MGWRIFLAGAIGIFFLSAFNFKAAPKVIKIASGGNQNCALFDNGKAKCWGANGGGQLGVGSTELYGATPGSMAKLPYIMVGEEIGKEDEFITDFDIGPRHACVLFKTGKVKCWGYNDYGQLGIGKPSGIIGVTADEMKNLPYVLVGEEIGKEDEKVIKVGVGRYTNCALFESNKMKCWGYNQYGQTGNGTTQNAGLQAGEMKSLSYALVGPEIGRDDEKMSKYVMSTNMSCALFESGKAKCWGADFYGALGLGLNGQTTNLTKDGMTNLPYILVGEIMGRKDEKIIDISHYDNHTCVIFASGKMKCWGGNDNGQLGLGMFENAIGRLSTDFKDLLNVFIGSEAGIFDDVPVQVSNSLRSTCVLYSNGQVQCWGANSNGELGVDDSIDRGKFRVDEEGMSPYVKL